MSRLGDTLRSIAFAGGDAKAGEIVDERPLAREVHGSRQHTTGDFGPGAKRALETYGSGTHYAIDLVADALEVIGSTAATADWYLEDPTAQTRKAAIKYRHRVEADRGEHLAPRDLVELLENPNPWMGYEEWMELSWIDWILTGDSFTLKFRPDEDGKPLSLYRLAPDLVEVVPASDGNLIKSYKYAVPGEEAVEYRPQDVIHIRRPNPHNPYRGAGVIACGPRVFDLEVALQDTKARYFEQGTRLSGVLESKEPIGPSIIASIRNEFAALFAGVDASYQVPVLQRGLKWKAIQGTAAEAEFAKMTEKSQERLLAKFGVPRRKLGLPIETSSTTAPQAEERTFAQDRMRPAMNKFQNALTAQLTLAWGLRYRIKYDYEMPIEERIKLASEFASLPGVMVKEVREFAKLPALEGENAQHAELLLNLPGENDDESDIKDRRVGREGGRTPKGENTASFDRAGDPDARVR